MIYSKWAYLLIKYSFKITFFHILQYVVPIFFVRSRKKKIFTRKSCQYFRATIIMVASNIYICFTDILTYYSACNGSLEQLNGIIRMQRRPWSSDNIKGIGWLREHYHIVCSVMVFSSKNRCFLIRFKAITF